MTSYRREGNVIGGILCAMALACSTIAAQPAARSTAVVPPAAEVELSVAERNEAAAWFDVATQHHLEANRQLVATRGFQSPVKRVTTLLKEHFPLATVVLVYDFVPDWDKGRQYGTDDIVMREDAAYARTQVAGGAGDPAWDLRHWQMLHRTASKSREERRTRPLRVWLLSDGDIDAYQAMPFDPAQFEELLDAFHASISERMAEHVARPRGFLLPGPARQHLTMDAALAQIARALIPASFWPRLQRAGQIVVVPEIAIAEVPFALFTAPDGRLLTETSSMWVARSISDLAERDLGGSEHEHDTHMGGGRWTFDHPLVVGNPSFQLDEHWILPPLHGAESEAIAVSAVLNTKPLLRSAALKSAIVGLAPQSDLIYLATHGVALPDDPMAGFLALAGAPSPQGQWTAREIQSLDLTRTDLAVLSACQTGLGRALAGGVIGVGRAFASAGVRWVVMSLWNVDDEATKNLMLSFIREIKSCSGEACLPAVALRSAMARMRKEDPDPRLWGAFVVLGTPDGRQVERLPLKP